MISFRRALPEDAEELTRIQFEAFAQADAIYTNIRGYEPPPGYDSVEAQQAAITQSLYYKMLDEGAIVGGFILLKENESHIMLARIFIRPVFQNAGIGTQAFRFMEAMYPRCRRWTVLTPFLSYRNHHFYEKLGFVKVGETEPMFTNGYVMFMFEKRCDLVTEIGHARDWRAMTN